MTTAVATERRYTVQSEASARPRGVALLCAPYAGACVGRSLWLSATITTYLLQHSNITLFSKCPLRKGAALIAASIGAGFVCSKPCAEHEAFSLALLDNTTNRHHFERNA